MLDVAFAEPDPRRDLFDGVGLRVAVREDETERQRNHKAGYEPEAGVLHIWVRFYQTNRQLL